jgi:hypothetical protein
LTFTLLPNGLEQSDSLFTNLSGGFYEVIVMDEAGCADTLEVEVIEPDPLLVLLDDVQGSEPDAAEGSIAISVEGGTEPYAFAWIQLDGAYASGEEDLEGLNPGTYQVEVTDGNGCSVVSFEIVVEQIVGIDVVKADASLRVYPNPATDWIRVDCPISGTQWSVQMHALDGRLVWEQVRVVPGQLLTIPLDDLANGQYVIHAHDAHTHLQHKVQVFR